MRIKRTPKRILPNQQDTTNTASRPHHQDFYFSATTDSYVTTSLVNSFPIHTYDDHLQHSSQSLLGGIQAKEENISSQQPKQNHDTPHLDSCQNHSFVHITPNSSSRMNYSPEITSEMGDKPPAQTLPKKRKKSSTKTKQPRRKLSLPASNDWAVACNLCSQKKQSSSSVWLPYANFKTNNLKTWLAYQIPEDPLHSYSSIKYKDVLAFWKAFDLTLPQTISSFAHCTFPLFTTESSTRFCARHFYENKNTKATFFDVRSYPNMSDQHWLVQFARESNSQLNARVFRYTQHYLQRKTSHFIKVSQHDDSPQFSDQDVEILGFVHLAELLDKHAVDALWNLIRKGHLVSRARLVNHSPLNKTHQIILEFAFTAAAFAVVPKATTDIYDLANATTSSLGPCTLRAAQALLPALFYGASKLEINSIHPQQAQAIQCPPSHKDYTTLDEKDSTHPPESHATQSTLDNKSTQLPTAKSTTTTRSVKTDVQWVYNAARRLPTDSDNFYLDHFDAAKIQFLNVTLRSYQERAVAWMLSRERLQAQDQKLRLHDFWIPLPHKQLNHDNRNYQLDFSDVPLYVNKYTGALSPTSYWISGKQGGILADEMGLGKTIEVLALITANSPPNVLLSIQDEINKHKHKNTCISCKQVIDSNHHLLLNMSTFVYKTINWNDSFSNLVLSCNNCGSFEEASCAYKGEIAVFHTSELFYCSHCAQNHEWIRRLPSQRTNNAADPHCVACLQQILDDQNIIEIEDFVFEQITDTNYYTSSLVLTCFKCRRLEHAVCAFHSQTSVLSKTEQFHCTSCGKYDFKQPILSYEENENGNALSQNVCLVCDKSIHSEQVVPTISSSAEDDYTSSETDQKISSTVSCVGCDGIVHRSCLPPALSEEADDQTFLCDSCSTQKNLGNRCVTCKRCVRKNNDLVINTVEYANELDSLRFEPNILFSCIECEQVEHALCANRNHTILDAETNFLCTRCTGDYQASKKIESRATLIVCPSFLLQQWETELTQHSGRNDIKIISYFGMSSKGYVSSKTMTSADIVLTTYYALKQDIHHSDVQKRNLRYEKKYPVIPTPLLRVKFWRICLDEAQMIEKGGSLATQMACRLESDRRWCVSGTPVRRGFEDLGGLIAFIGIEPYSQQVWWSRLMVQGASEPEKRTFVRNIMWRSAKQDVEKEINIPVQYTTVKKLTFGPIEKQFYSKLFEACRESFLNIVVKGLEISSIFKKRNGNENIATFCSALLRLRQACCHPQVGGTTLRALKPNEAMSMHEVLENLVKRAKIDVDEAFRALIAARNGLSAVCIISEDRDLAMAVDLYRGSLALEDDSKEYVKMDNLQKYHIFNNLADVLDMMKSDTKSLRDKSLEKIGRTLRDESLRQDSEVIAEKYTNEARLRLDQSKSNYEILKEEYNLLLKKDLHMWPLYAVEWLGKQHSFQKDEFVDKIKLALEDGIQVKFKSIATLLLHFPSLLKVINDGINARENARKRLITALETLPGWIEPTKDQVLISGRCKKCKPGMVGEVCFHCKKEELFIEYERHLFLVRSKVNKTTLRNVVLEQGDGGVRLQSEFEKMAKVIIAQLRKYDHNGKDMINNGQAWFDMTETAKKEYKEIHKVFGAEKVLLNALDEIDMAKMRIHLRVGDERIEPHEERFKLRIEDVASRSNELTVEHRMSLAQFYKKKGQLVYLEQLRKKDTQVDDKCPVCWQDISSEMALFTCGHVVCIECASNMIRRIVPQAGETSGDVRNSLKSIQCPQCRTRSVIAEIGFIESINRRPDFTEYDMKVKGSFGTKIEAIIAKIMEITETEDGSKVLVFSQWNNALEIVSQGLSENVIPHVRVDSLSNFRKNQKKKNIGQKLDAFRTNQNMKVLLLPIRSGGSGLNLTEANHVIFVEPLMNPALEAQAIGRIDRIGQRRETYVHRFFITNTIEERIIERKELHKNEKIIMGRHTQSEMEAFSEEDIREIMQI